MFYPIQSSQYAHAISKRIFQTFRSYNVFVQLTIGLFLLGATGTVSLKLSIGWGVLFILLLWICLIDFIDRIIPDILTFAVLLTILSMDIPIQWVGCISIIALIVLKVCAEYMYHRSLVGWGDFKLISVCLLFTPLYQLPVFLLTMGVSGIALSILLRSKAIPFAPCIIFGFVAVFVVGV
jgi:prepilin signal peptidase PulO-like enzyme (type II secretory pathway)